MSDFHSLKPLEALFCALYSGDGSDPMGLWQRIFDPEETLPLEQVAFACGTLLERADIATEIYAQRRIREDYGNARLGIIQEIEEARQKALDSHGGAGVALEASIAKAKLLDLLPSEYSLAHAMADDPSSDPRPTLH